MNKENIELFKKNWKLFFREEICNDKIIYIEKLVRQAKDEERERRAEIVEKSIHKENSEYTKLLALKFAKAIRDA